VKRALWILPVALVLAACTLPAVGGGTPTLAPPLAYRGLDSSILGSHQAEFRLQFDGDQSWSYRVTTRVSDQLLERSLHIEGVEGARNPGDVRLVSDGQVSRMIGPGTNEGCLQYPSDLDVSVKFLAPDDVLPVDDFREPLVSLGQEQVAGWNTIHFVMIQAELDGWQDVTVGLWHQPDFEAVLRYDLAAEGWDPFFEAGYGRLTGSYQVIELGPQAIEPITGCEPDLPLPADRQRLVILPGVVAFESGMSLEALSAHFRQQLPQAGWQTLVEEDRSSGAVVLSYWREGESLDVTIRDMGDFRRVELLRE
jgi:hypothetical protein